MPKITRRVPYSDVPKPWRAGLPKTPETAVIKVTLEVPSAEAKPDRDAQAFAELIANLNPSSPVRDKRPVEDIVREMRDARGDEVLSSPCSG